MTSDPPESDPRMVWKNLKTERQNLSNEETRTRALNLYANVRRNVAFKIASIFVVLGGDLALGLVNGPAVYGWKYAPLEILIAVWLLIVLRDLFSTYRAHGTLWPRSLATDAARASLDFYRRELERKYSSYSRRVQWAFPLILGIVAVILFVILAKRHSAPLLSILPLCAILLIWSGRMLYITRCEALQCRSELDELDQSFGQQQRS